MKSCIFLKKNIIYIFFSSRTGPIFYNCQQRNFKWNIFLIILARKKNVDYYQRPKGFTWTNIFRITTTNLSISCHNDNWPKNQYLKKNGLFLFYKQWEEKIFIVERRILYMLKGSTLTPSWIQPQKEMEQLN